MGRATALRVAAAAPGLVDSLAVIEPEAYALLRTQDPAAYAAICDLRDRWRADVRAGRWYEAYEAFVDFYNGPGAFVAADALAGLTARVHVIQGSRASPVDRAICAVVRQRLPHAQHTVIEGAGHMMPLTHPEPLACALLTGIEQ